MYLLFMFEESNLKMEWLIFVEMEAADFFGEGERFFCRLKKILIPIHNDGLKKI